MQTQPGKTETKNQSDRKPQSQPTKESLEKRLAAVKEQIEKIENTAYSAEKVKKLNQEKNTIQNKIKAAKKHDVKITAETSQAQKNAVKTSTKKKLFYRMTAVFTGLMAIGATILMTSDSSKMSNMVESNTSKTPTFKTVYASDATHSYVHTYNLGDSLSKTYNFDGQASNTIKTQPSGTTKPNIGPTESNTTTDAIAAQITKSSKSALDILLGAQKANELCHEVQSQIDAGIFAAPKGMSVERIAHAMTMSRIYEGRSIILDALKAKTKLTPADQAAFEQHIAEIGDMGTGLQKRMAEKHKLSTYSKFDNASKQLQKLHIQNLKTLKRMQKQAHTR